MRTPAVPALIVAALLAAAPHAMARPASAKADAPKAAAPVAIPLAFVDRPEVRYLIVDGQAFAVNALTVGGAAYVAVEEIAAHLGFEASARDKGLVLRSSKGAITFSEDFSMAIVGSHLHAVRPQALRTGDTVYLPAAFVTEHFARFASAPFSLRETPPPLELKTLPCSIRAEGNRWILGFESPPVHSRRETENALELFFEGQRLKNSAGGESPPGVRLAHERQPLGDRLRWSWDKAAPHAADVAWSEDGREFVVSFASARARGPRVLTTVILDPGHGGAASGAVGRRGMLEKDLALRIALKVRDLLKKHAVDVFMTRETDTDVSLAGRAEFANSRRGDLFVSIHANASRRASARGAETYFMSYEALDEESRLAVEIENREGGGAGTGDTVGAILSTMAQARFLDDSSRLAETIQRKFNAALSTPDRGVKQAPFSVLMGVAMPAVLVEVGFLSNPEEERLLEREEYRDRVARALVDSILAFKSARDTGDRREPRAAREGTEP